MLREHRNEFLELKSWNDKTWVLVSEWNCYPGMLLTAIKLYQFWRGEDLVRSKLNYYIAWLYRLLFGYCFFYYFVDSLSVVLLERWGNTCYQAFLLHHVISLVGLANSFSIHKDFWWFEMLMGAMHSWVLRAPKERYRQYLYFLTFPIFQFMIYRNPYKQYKQAAVNRWLFLPAYFSFLMMVYFDCLGMMDSANNKDIS
jgi:hypothetical protein